MYKMLDAFKVPMPNMYTCENQNMFWADIHLMLYIFIFELLKNYYV